MSELMPMQSPVTKIEPKIAARLAKQSYHLVGEHGGVKVCHWTKQSLIADRSCYKGTLTNLGSDSDGDKQVRNPEQAKTINSGFKPAL